MAKKRTAKRKPGRPKGSLKKERTEVDKVRPKCTRCGSTRRSNYTNSVRSDISGVSDTGIIYTAIIWRHCKCLDCGQHRVERELIYEPKK